MQHSALATHTAYDLAALASLWPSAEELITEWPAVISVNLLISSVSCSLKWMIYHIITLICFCCCYVHNWR